MKDDIEKKILLTLLDHVIDGAEDSELESALKDDEKKSDDEDDKE